MLARFSTTVAAAIDAIAHHGLIAAAATSFGALLKGYLLAVAITLCLVAAASANATAREALATVTAMLNPLPAIALLPLAMPGSHGGAAHGEVLGNAKLTTPSAALVDQA